MKFADILALAAKPAVKAETAASLRSALAAIEIPALQRAADVLQDERQRLLLTATDEELASMEARITTADRAAERAEAARAELERRLETAETRERREALSGHKAEAARLTEVAVASIEKELPVAFASIRAVLRKIAEAEIAVSAVNTLLPPDEAVPGPEDVRHAKHARPAKEIKRQNVSLWYDPFNRSVLPDHLQHLVRIDERDLTKGTFTSTAPNTTASAMRVELRHYERVTRHPAERPTSGGALSDTVVLPPVHAGEVDGWQPGITNDPVTMLKQLDQIEAALAARPGRNDRRPEVILVPIPETPAARAA